MDDTFRPLNWMWTVEGFEGQRTAREFSTPKTFGEYQAANAEMWERTKAFVRKHADSDKPFMLQWWPNLYEVADEDAMRPWTTQHATASAESIKRMDAKIGELFAILDELGIAENTIVIAMADNGPMEPIWPETGQNGFFRGGKNDVTEGGIRVPAFIKWPGVIEPGSVAGDIIHVSDLFNTFARISGRYDEIPTDRVIDGIDQTALLMNGDTHGRRDYVFTYKGPALGSVVKQQFKRHYALSTGALAGAEFFDIYKDPREEHPLMAEFLWTWAQFDDVVARHNAQIKEYPHSAGCAGRALHRSGEVERPVTSGTAFAARYRTRPRRYSMGGWSPCASKSTTTPPSGFASSMPSAIRYVWRCLTAPFASITSVRHQFPAWRPNP